MSDNENAAVDQDGLADAIATVAIIAVVVVAAVLWVSGH